VEEIKLSVFVTKEAWRTIVAALDQVHSGSGEHDARMSRHGSSTCGARSALTKNVVCP
jgi:hypothetical protein